MRRQLDHGYEVDDDPARIDIDVAHAYLTESYWAEGRTRETVESLVAGAARVIGIYTHDKMVGFCRVESDDVTFAFLLDVFVLPDHRGEGLASSSCGNPWSSVRTPICAGISAPETHIACTSGSASVSLTSIARCSAREPGGLDLARASGARRRRLPTRASRPPEQPASGELGLDGSLERNGGLKALGRPPQHE